MIFILSLCFTLGSTAKGGPFYAEPSYVTNLKNTHPETTEFFFYLQQMNKSTTLFRGDVQFKRNVGPMRARIDYQAWTGKQFTRPSGATQDLFIPNACDVHGILQFLNGFEPKSNFNVKECTFLAGNYTVEIDWDKNLHDGNEFLNYEPVKLHFMIFDVNAMLFGVTIQIKFHDLNLYRFIPKD